MDSDAGVKVVTSSGDHLAVSPGKKGNWSDRIGIPLLLAAVFAAGGAWAQLAVLSTQLEAFGRKANEDHDRIVRLEAAREYGRLP